MDRESNEGNPGVMFKTRELTERADRNNNLLTGNTQTADRPEVLRGNLVICSNRSESRSQFTLSIFIPDLV